MDVCGGSASTSMSMEDRDDMACGVELLINGLTHRGTRYGV
jgi:hypothetical protein